MRQWRTCRYYGKGVVGIVCFGLIASAATAQSMKPGLWEVSNTIGGSGEMGAQMAAAQAEMKKQLAAMTPAQRRQIEQMMAQRGMSIGAGSGATMSSRICITEEMAARNQPPARQQGDCKQEYSRSGGNTTRFKFVCTDPSSSGEGEMILHSPESYSMKMTAVSEERGKPEQMTMSARGKWLSNDCGNVRPR